VIILNRLAPSLAGDWAALTIRFGKNATPSIASQHCGAG
jgi:hypothetical protein